MDYLIFVPRRVTRDLPILIPILVKSIAEELRGLGCETSVPSYRHPTTCSVMVFDVDLTDTSESFGLPATADLMFALISTEEL